MAPIQSLCRETDLAELEKALSPRFYDSLLEDEGVLTHVAASVKQYMSQYDLSHDYQHILRVLTLSRRILECESTNPESNYDAQTVFLSALVHDIGDHKYIQEDEDATQQITSILLKSGAPPSLAATVSTIAKSVSYTSEIKNPKALQGVLQKHPELAIVQDADRLDAIGATGIGRTFAYGGAKLPWEGLQAPREHISEKLEGFEGLMKTQTGRHMAVERTNRLRMFVEWWDEEMSLEARGRGAGAL